MQTQNIRGFVRDCFSTILYPDMEHCLGVRILDAGNAFLRIVLPCQRQSNRITHTLINGQLMRAGMI